jgi:hypothetical protein
MKQKDPTSLSRNGALSDYFMDQPFGLEVAGLEKLIY